tara:strand:+ start:1031 stop:1321 length:291 start_codon:yes stop_codon:yes gene_type:complete
MSKKRTLKLTKIPITAMMQILADLFEDGVDFIDIEGEENEIKGESDRIKVTIKPEYYSSQPEIELELEQDQEDALDFFPPIEINKKLTDEDINDLI